ncbi:MAG: putative two-component system sensor kinase [Verrucomicrobiales bacterium]|nr:putative two-component system sensor kinase [Verrucomicrobiales bacterium]
MSIIHRSPWLFWRGGIFIFMIFLFCLPSNSRSAGLGSDSPFLQRIWQGENGLPHDSVQAILQTDDGYLWVGTRRGLARFDGIRFAILDKPGLANENIFTLCEDRNGSLWIGTEKGVVRLTERETLSYRQVDGLVHDNVRIIYQSKDGSIWIGTTGGLSQFKDGKFYNYTRNEDLPHDVVRSICEDDLGNLWIATDGGLCRFKDGTISVPHIALGVGSAVRSICLDGERNLWVGTQIGLFRLKRDDLPRLLNKTDTWNPATDRWDHFDRNQAGLSDDFVNIITVDRGGQLWVGTYGGLNRMVNGKFFTELANEGSAYDLVNAVLEDREGNIWIGSKEGLTQLKIKPLTAVTKPQGLTYNNVMAVLQDRSGTFWCGTWGGGLFQMKVGENGYLAITNRIADKRILSLCEGKDGALWFGADHSDGLYRLQDSVLTHYDEKNRLEKIGIPVIYQDHEGNLWIGTSRSLALLRDEQFIHYTPKDGLAGEWVKVILEDKEGNLWIGTNNGLSRRKNGKFTNFTTTNGLSHNTVLSLYEDKQNNLWIGTGGGGLNRLRNGQFTAYTTRHGLFNDEVLEILEDDFDYLWMTSLKGIFRVSKKALDKLDRKEIESLPCTSYGKDDGMISIICGNVSKPGGWKGSDGRLWFPTTKGMVIADPKIKTIDTPPPVAIEEILADKKIIREAGGRKNASQRGNSSDLVSHLIVPPGRGELELHYTALSFRASEKNRFKYKLEGVDPDWVDAGTRRIAYYNNLGPGQYNFRVKACNNDGVWNSSGPGIKLSLQPQYWQTWWFKTFAIVGSLSIAAAGARFATRKRMASKLERLEQRHAIEKERTRIAQDMHDDLGVRLSEILLLSDMTHKKDANLTEVQICTGKIGRATRELVDNLDAIVWAVNPKNDSLDKFADYLVVNAPLYLEMSGIRCGLDVPSRLPPYPLSSEIRHNLFLVVREALHNTIKHAQASEVRILLSIEDETLRLDIVDNGKGFTTESDLASGNGLINMEARMKNIGGSFQLASESGNGTRISLNIRLKNSLSK